MVICQIIVWGYFAGNRFNNLPSPLYVCCRDGASTSNSVTSAIGSDSELNAVLQSLSANTEELNNVVKSTWKKLANFDRYITYVH